MSGTGNAFIGFYVSCTVTSHRKSDKAKAIINKYGSGAFSFMNGKRVQGYWVKNTDDCTKELKALGAKNIVIQ